MSVDLSKAKIGDKFRTRDGHIMVYTSRNRYILGGLGEYVLTTEEEFPIHNEDGDGWTKLSLYYFSDGTGNDGLPLTANNVVQSLQEKIPIRVPYGYELVEQVLDKPLDELTQEATKQFKENGRYSKEGENMKEKCVCEWLREQEYSVNFEDCQEFQFKNAEIVFNKKEDSEIRVDIEYQPSLKTWKIAAYGKNDIVDFSINYCPFCGRKLN